MKKWILKKMFTVNKQLHVEWSQIHNAQIKETLKLLGISIYSRYRLASEKDVDQYLGI